MLIPVIRHGFTFWEAPHCANPPLPELDEPADDFKVDPERPRDLSPEVVERRARKKASQLACLHKNPFADPPPEIPSSLKAVQDAVMTAFGIPPQEFFANTKANRIALPRIASMALCRELTSHSLVEIGRAHKKDHGTVLHACQRFEDLRETDSNYRARAEQAEAAIRGA